MRISRDGKSQRREEKKKEDQKRKSPKKKIQVREKVGKSRNTVFCHWFVAPEGRIVGSLKQRVRSQLARWEMKNCTPLWHKANFEVKMYKAPHVRSTCRKSARHCGAKHISKSSVSKTDRFGALLEVEMSKKCTPLWREAHFEVESAKNCGVRSAFEGSDVVPRGRGKGLCTLSKVSKTWGLSSSFKNDGRRGTYAEDLARCISSGRGSARDMFIRAVGRCGR